MDPVHKIGPWTPGPCFVLTRVTIVRRGAKENRRGGLSIKNNTKIAGLKLKLLSLQGGPNFHFMSCAFALNCKIIPHAL